MPTKRTKTEIIAQILEIAKNDDDEEDERDSGTTKTKIMYGAYMSYTQTQEYLSALLGQGLIRHIREENKYRTTKKGKEFLEVVSKSSGLGNAVVDRISGFIITKEMLKN